MNLDALELSFQPRCLVRQRLNGDVLTARRRFHDLVENRSQMTPDVDAIRLGLYRAANDHLRPLVLEHDIPQLRVLPPPR